MKKFLTTAPVFAAVWFTITAGINPTHWTCIASTVHAFNLINNVECNITWRSTNSC